MPRYALALHGRLGTLHMKPQQSIDLHANASRRIARFSGASIRKHIVDAQDGAAVDVFIHSWNPERAALIDMAYGPVQASVHEPPQRRLPKAQSQALSIARVAHLISAHERRRRIEYTLVLVLRLDVVVASRLNLSQMDPAHIWFAQRCCLDRAESLDERLAVRAACGDGAGNQQSTGGSWWSRRLVRRCRVDHYGHPVCGKKWCGLGGGERRARTINAAYFLMDWWFAASRAVVQTWGHIASLWDMRYLARARELHIAYEAPKLWSHFVWAMHVREVLNRTRDARFLPDSAFRIGLARMAWPQTLAARGCPLDVVHMQSTASDHSSMLVTRPVHGAAITTARARLLQAAGAADGKVADGEVDVHSSALEVWMDSCPVDEEGISQSSSEPMCCGRKGRGGAFRTCSKVMPRNATADAMAQEAACAAGREAILPFAIAACEEAPEVDEPSDMSPTAPCHMAALARRKTEAHWAKVKRRRAAATKRAARRGTLAGKQRARALTMRTTKAA